MKRLAILLGALVMAITVAVPAGAITDGEPAGDRHPEVVLILMEEAGEPAYRCSGTLVSPTIVLTAGHCTGEPGEFSGMRIFTESDVENGDNNYPYGGGKNSVEAKRWATHPLYTSAAFYLHDVGMIELQKPVKLPRGASYGKLPKVDQLDALATKRGQAAPRTSPPSDMGSSSSTRSSWSLSVFGTSPIRSSTRSTRATSATSRSSCRTTPRPAGRASAIRADPTSSAIRRSSRV